MKKIYVNIKILKAASQRTYDRLLKFQNKEYRIELIKTQKNESLKGDGFVVGEFMNYFGVDICDNGLWSRAWEGWIPNKEIEIIYD
jgi:hypothetical protein